MDQGLAPEVEEASPEQLSLLRHLLSLASQPADDWSCFDDEGAGPLQQYRYQVNALGWAISTYQYAHAPAAGAILTAAQLALFERAQHKAVWGYWYWQNLLGNWDFMKRRADPIDVPQNIMFTGYLNLQLAMFRQASGDDRFDRPGSIAFHWSEKQRFDFDNQRINDIAVRNFGQDLCLWPCEPLPSPGRRRGLVFPYCNAVTLAGVSVMDAANGTSLAPPIAARMAKTLEREYTTGANDIAALIASGVGFSLRSGLTGTVPTAAVAAYLVTLCPDLAWRAWELLKRDWLITGNFRQANSAGAELPDWSSNAKTNTEALAVAMMLASAFGDQEWHDQLWSAAVDQLDFVPADNTSPAARHFEQASVHGNGMLGFGALGRSKSFNDILTRPRPAEWERGPRLAEAPHPEVLVAKAVTDGRGLDMVLRPGHDRSRVVLQVDRLTPGGRYLTHGAVGDDVLADSAGAASISVDIGGRTVVELRPV